MKCFIIFLFLLINSIYLFPQDSLTLSRNQIRNGDKLIKQQVEYKNSGRSGANVLWDFSNLKTIDDKYQLSFANRDDSLIIGTEHRTMYFYEQRGDSLLFWGYENPTTKMQNYLPEIIMKFPMGFQAKTGSYFAGEGSYCDRLSLTSIGYSESLIDAYGMIVLPNQDTLDNVLRIKTRKLLLDNKFQLNFNGFKDSLKLYSQTICDSIDYYLKNDSIVLEVETYRWYVQGYRYPIFETIRTGSMQDSLKSEYFSTAFFFPPEEHSYLANDDENLNEQNRLYKAQVALWDGTKSISSDSHYTLNREISYNVYPNPVQSILAIEYYLPETAKISFALYSMSGQILISGEEKLLLSGINIEKIDISKYPKGAYILQIKIDDKTKVAKILKD